MWRIGDLITERFALFNPATGARLTAGATFTAVAHDGAGTDISSQITVTADILNSGIYTFSFTAAVEGTYVVSIVETTTNQQIQGSYVVGGSLADRLWNLSSQGETVTLGNGGGGYSYTGTVTIAGSPQAGILVRAYQAQDPEVGGGDTGAVTDLQTVIAQATTDNNGHFTLMLALSYYTLMYFVNNLPYQTYIRWSYSKNAWVVSGSPIPTSQL